MTTIAAFETPEEAHLVRIYLAERGIESFLYDEHTIQTAWYLSNAIGGVRIAVNEEDRASAKAELETYVTSLRKEPQFTQPVRLWPLVLILSFCLGGPFILFGRDR